jgi:hypothetical protein
MNQVDELLALIVGHKEIGVTGASVMFHSSNAESNQSSNAIR